MSIAMKNMIDAALALNRKAPYARPSVASSLDDFKRQLFEAVKKKPAAGNVDTLMSFIEESDLVDVAVGLNKRVAFDCENICSLEYNEINGHQLLVMEAGGDWEYPVTVFVYWNGIALAGYVPVSGNTYNKVSNTAFGSEGDGVQNLPEDEVLDRLVEAYIASLPEEPEDLDLYNTLGLIVHLGDDWKSAFSEFGEDGYPTDPSFVSPTKDAMDIVDPDMSKMLDEFAKAASITK